MLLLPQTTIDPSASTTAPESLCTVTGCIPVQELLGLVILVSSGLLGLVVGLSYLATARDAVSEERRRVEAEQTAFARFARRVAGIDPIPPGREATAGGTTLVVDATDDALAEVRQAYRDTVMAVDHYADDYDESLPENLEEEFGPELATAVVKGPGYRPSLQAALVDRSRSVIRARQSLLDELDEESASLSRAGDTLSAVRSTLSAIREDPLSADFDVLRDRWERLEQAETACVEAVADRQRSLEERDAFGLAQYLYDDLPLQSPVLAEAGGLVGSVRSRRRETEHLLAELG